MYNRGLGVLPPITVTRLDHMCVCVCDAQPELAYCLLVMDISKFLSLLKTCTNPKSLRQAKLVHQRILTSGLQNDIVFCKSFVNVYFSCKDHNSARLVFETLKNPIDISLWNSLMSGYTKNFMFHEALEVFERLLRYPFCFSDCYTYPNVLKGCGALGRGFYGKMIHTLLVKNGHLCDVVVASSLVSMYAKCNLFEYSIQVFDEMPDRDVASWNTVISCYYQSGEAEKALELFGKMKDSGFDPNSVTLTIAVSACSRLSDLERGKEIHRECVNKGFASDEYVSSALVDMYGKCGCLEMARVVFEHMQRKTVVAWNSMIQGYVSKGDTRSCVELLNGMVREGTKPTQTTLTSILIACSKSSNLRYGRFIHGYVVKHITGADIFINCSLIDLYFNCGEVKSAENLFQMAQKTAVVSWNVMISGYVSAGMWFKALTMYEQMVNTGVKPDAVTFTSVLPACSQLAALEKGKQIHLSIHENKLETDELVMGALLDMYSKCGDVEEASRIFYSLPEKDVISWTAMITAYGTHGQAQDALKLFGEMKKFGINPDGVAFLAMLSACSHGGLVDEGLLYFNQMRTEHRIKPGIAHYSCLIDLLGRSGRLLEAYEILEQNPEMKDNADLLSTLFAACCLHREHELGEKVARLLGEKDDNDASTYIVLSNLYASGNRWHEVKRVRWKMKEMGLKKNPGCSWIEIDGQISTFFAEDKSHPQAEKVYEYLELLNDHIDEEEDSFCATFNVLFK